MWSATTTAVATTAYEGRWAAAMRFATMTTAATAAMASAASMTTWVRICRGGDRQRRGARDEKHPGQHGNSPFEREKRPVRCTVPIS